MSKNDLSILLLFCIALLQFQSQIYAADNIVIREQHRSLSSQYAAFRKGQLDNIQYQLSVDISKPGDLFTGKVSIDFELAINNNSPVTVDFDNGEILAVSVNGNSAEWDYEKWFITLSPALFKDGNNNLVIEYRRPYANDGSGFHKFTDPATGNVFLYTNFEPYNANRLFPHFDQPNLKASYTLDVIAPSDWHVIANTRESEIIDNAESRHWYFPPTAYFSSYVFALHAGPYSVWEASAGEIPLRLFARPSLAEFVNTEEWFIPTQQSFAFFQDYFDIPYPFGKYDQIIVPDFNPGAMENVGAVTFNERRYISRGEKSVAELRRLAYVIAHEMAHMWFGDLVTMDWWNGLWLNESFATYMGYLALDESSDFEDVWDNYYVSNKLSAYSADELVTTHPIELEVPTTADAFTNFDSITYNKGGSVLKQLPYFIGEENFRLGVSNYLKRHAYSNTSLDDFVTALEEASGMDLSQWKQEWLYSSGVNTVQAEFNCRNDELTSLVLLQTTPATTNADQVLRSQRTQVGLYRLEEDSIILTNVIPVTYSGASTEVAVNTDTDCPDLVLPNESDWAYFKINLDDKSRSTARQHINKFNNPATRIMLWQSLWDSVQDGLLPLPEYVEFAINNIGDENNENVLRRVEQTLRIAMSYYLRAGNGTQYNARLASIESFIRQELLSSAPGSEQQKIWYESFVNSSHTVDNLALMLELLQGTETIPGLQIDQDKRWQIIITLNEFLYGDYATLLTQEIARDPSDTGSNMALAAEAVRPQPETKDRFLDLVINNPEAYKLAAMRTIMAYLFPTEQNALLAANSERLMGQIPDLNATADLGYLDAYMDYLVPATCSDESVARLAQALEDFADFQPLVIKALMVEHQQDARCLRMARSL